MGAVDAAIVLLGATGAILIIPLGALFNVTIVLYTVPAGYFIAKTVSKNLKVGVCI